MYVQTIELKYLGENPPINVEDFIGRFCASLKSNGQTLTELLIVKNDGGYVLYASTPKRDSLNERFDSIFVKRDREALNQYFSVTVNLIGINIESQEYCSCQTRKAMEMQTFARDIDSVFTCCTCGKPIALYELPYIEKQDDHWYIKNWQNTYGATDTLWLDSLSDRFTGNQLVNVNSALNKNGKQIAREIAQKAAIKVYYNIFDDFTKKVKFVTKNGKRVRLCPTCEKAMKHVKFCDGYERFVCEDCSLSSDLPKEN